LNNWNAPFFVHVCAIVDRSLADSKAEAVSNDLRFIAAFNAALCVATTALRASGLRPSNLRRIPARQDQR
jgi:hypothetical protein